MATCTAGFFIQSGTVFQDFLSAQLWIDLLLICFEIFEIAILMVRKNSSSEVAVIFSRDDISRIQVATNGYSAVVPPTVTVLWCHQRLQCCGATDGYSAVVPPTVTVLWRHQRLQCCGATDGYSAVAPSTVTVLWRHQRLQWCGARNKR